MKDLPEKAHYSVEELAMYWDVTPHVVRKQIYNGALQAKRIGREYRIAREIVIEYGAVATT